MGSFPWEGAGNHRGGGCPQTPASPSFHKAGRQGLDLPKTIHSFPRQQEQGSERRWEAVPLCANGKLRLWDLLQALLRELKSGLSKPVPCWLSHLGYPLRQASVSLCVRRESMIHSLRHPGTVQSSRGGGTHLGIYLTSL